MLPGAAGSADATRVSVRASDFTYRLSRVRLPVGTVRFEVRNLGAQAHDFVVNRKRTRLLRRGGRQTVSVRFTKPGRYRFYCSVPGHARLGMQGTVTVGRVTTPPPPPSPPPPPPVTDQSDKLTLTKIGDFSVATDVTAPPSDPERVFVVEQRGVVDVLQQGRLLAEPFLDLSHVIIADGEKGLLSLAFAPDYAASGRFYVFYNDVLGAIRVVEYRRSEADANRADPATARDVLRIPKVGASHNGGDLQFGPDGYLYVSVGDGQTAGLAQRRDSLFGSILRIDPRGGEPYAVPATNPYVGQPDARPEVLFYGLRNPWRFWIDAPTGQIAIADVGADYMEEVNLVPAGAVGLNFGWPCWEGTRRFDTELDCGDTVGPVYEYAHSDEACSVIGGVVVRDPRLPELTGLYLLGDLCGPTFRALRFEGGTVVSSGDLGLGVRLPVAFGTDGLDRVYVTSAEGGIYRIDPRG